MRIFLPLETSKIPSFDGIVPHCLPTLPEKRKPKSGTGHNPEGVPKVEALDDKKLPNHEEDKD